MCDKTRPLQEVYLLPPRTPKLTAVCVLQVDGELTLGENIADNGGLHESVRAYRRYLDRHRIEEPHLPGMANYSHEQLLFLSYVHVSAKSGPRQGHVRATPVPCDPSRASKPGGRLGRAALACKQAAV